MSNSAENSALQQAAVSLYRWFEGEDPDPQITQALSEYTGSPIDIEKLRRLGERLRQKGDFLARQRPILKKWRACVESAQGPSAEEAYALLQDFFQGFDHALLYDYDIQASSTRVSRGALSASETRVRAMPCWTLHLTIGGNALFLSDGMEACVGAGDMMLLRPEANYHYGLHPRANNWEHLWALFQPRTYWEELLEWPQLDRGILLLSLPQGEAQRRQERLFRELIELGAQPDPMQSELQYNKLEEILIRAHAGNASLTARSLDPRIQRACDYLQAHLADNVRIDAVAAHCNLSTSRLAHLFKEQTGMAPKAWLNDRRLQKARRLLLNGNDSIASIGAQVGFDDPSHFTRYFSQSMGCSPRQFRSDFRDAAAAA
ncbi:MAG: arabinose operon transcriptional regulator AraC [Halioglobus sp.]|nr:arabinose operon transcriptional regulator AraC [Halioglobus sp.]|tara:strand:- start:5423 stop:6547 length:1125 start_codon:yes stop_codon:yes gene_type:complete